MHKKDWKDDAWVIAHMRQWRAAGLFDWPSEACGVEQHKRFVEWCYRHGHVPTDDPEGVAHEYADALERGDVPMFWGISKNGFLVRVPE